MVFVYLARLDRATSPHPSRSRAACSRAISSCAASRRSRFSVTTSSGARLTKSAFASFCAVFFASASNLSRSLIRRACSTAISISPSSGSTIVASSSTAWAHPFGTSPTSAEMSDARARRRMASIHRSTRPIDCAEAPCNRTGDGFDGGTFISARTDRTRVISRTTQSSSARACSAPGATTGDGQAVPIRLDGSP